MKSVYKNLGIIALAAVIGFSMAACGGSKSPEALAQETFDLSKQALGAALNPKKAAELAKKSTDIQARLAKMSEDEQQRYAKELARLTNNAAGDLFNSAGGLLDAASNLSNDAYLQNAQNALDSAQQTLDSAQQTLDTAQQATDLLNSFGK